MDETLLSRSGDFRTILNSATLNGTVIEVFDFSTVTAPYQEKYKSGYEVGFKCVLEEISATVSLRNSFIQAQIPNIYPEDSWADRLAKQMDIEQRFPYLLLTLQIDNLDDLGWVDSANVPLFNYGGEYYQPLLYPYLSQNDIRLMGPKEKIGVTINKALTEGDYIYIKGCYSVDIGVIQL